MTPRYYILNGHIPIPEKSVIKWGQWLETSEVARRVARTRIGGTIVSTVFLGLDHNFSMTANQPILFETAAFGTDTIDSLWRTATWDDAQAKHDEVVAEIRNRPSRKIILDGPL